MNEEPTKDDSNPGDSNPDDRQGPVNAAGETAETVENGSGSAETDAPATGTGLSEDHVRQALKEVIDPELFVNIVDLGLIYTVDVVQREDGKYDVGIEMTMTSPMCPAGPQLVGNSRQVVLALPQVEEVDVKVVMDPPWTQEMMTDEAKDHLNIF